MSAARPDPYKPPYVLVRAPMNTKDPDEAFSETLTYVEFWRPPDFCRYVIHGLSAELVSDRKSYDITCKTNDAPYYVLSKLKGIPTVSELLRG